MKNCSSYNKELWNQYIHNVLADSHRERMESHLWDCPHCLDTYASLIESSILHDERPYPTDHLTEKIMSSIIPANPPEFAKSMPQPSFYRSTIVHYLIAASITFLLIGSGVFDIFFEGTRVYAAQRETVTKASEWKRNLQQTASAWISVLFQNSIGGQNNHEKK